MEKIYKDFLKALTKKYSPIVLTKWMDIECIRSKAKPRSVGPSEAQLAQQEKFKLCASFLSTMSPLLNVGFINKNKKQIPFNYAMSALMHRAIMGKYPDYSIYYPNVLISIGGLNKVGNPLATMAANGELLFSWIDNSGEGLARATDQMLLVAHCPTLHQTIYSMGIATRSAQSAILQLSAFAGQPVHVYLGVVMENKKHATDSVYLGEFVVGESIYV